MLFKKSFFIDYNTVLCGGALEPEYLPADAVSPTSRLVYREDFFASALHEIAHWCIAGEQRRQQVDFGYWYEADGRSANLQRAFFAAEIKPQALEMLFSLCAGYAFKISVDNTEQIIDTRPFERAVRAQAKQYCCNQMPPRAWQFCRELNGYYNGYRGARQLARRLNKQLDHQFEKGCVASLSSG